MQYNLAKIIKTRLQQREDTEHEQAIIRLIISIIWLLYILWLSNDHFFIPEVLILSNIFVFASASVFICTIIDPKKSFFRRSFVKCN